MADAEAVKGPMRSLVDVPQFRTTPRLTSVEVESPALGPCLQISALFGYQSYFDTTLLQNALVAQPSSSPIVGVSTELQEPGYGLALHPASETPIAVSVKGRGGKVGGSGVLVLSPGQIVAPLGKESFSSFKWGLPYGWLGGGQAALLVLQTPPLEPQNSASRPEVVFHRVTLAVKQPSDLTSAGSFNNAPINWPTRFPWTNALSGSSKVPQSGLPTIAVEPTKTVLKLRATSLAADSAMRVIMQGTDAFSLDNGGTAGSIALTVPVYQDVTWKTFGSLGTSGNMATQHQTMVLDATNILTRLGANLAGPSSSTVNGGVIFLDASGASMLNGLFVDVTRYGRL